MYTDMYTKEHHNQSYRIMAYQLPNEYINILNEKLNNSSNFSNNTFQFIATNQLDFSNPNHLASKPDIILIDDSQIITEEIQKFSEVNMAQIIRVSNQPTLPIDSGTISISSEKTTKQVRIGNQTQEITPLEEGISWIITNAQIANTSKLQHISQKLLNKEQEKVIPLDDKDAVIETLMKLNYFIRLKDDYTQMHSDDVSKYATLIGEELGLPQEEINLLRIGGELHDIGKIGIPDAILKKQDSLTDDEFKIMQKHVIIGDAILPKSEEYQKIREMIKYHHEKMDGRGYPDGLKGEEIPYYARILSVADTFDAMTTQRSYNKKKTLNEAFEELRKSSMPRMNQYQEMTQQLDPELVECFISAIQKNQELMENFNKRDQEILNERLQKQLEMEQTQPIIQETQERGI